MRNAILGNDLKAKYSNGYEYEIKLFYLSDDASLGDTFADVRHKQPSETIS